MNDVFADEKVSTLTIEIVFFSSSVLFSSLTEIKVTATTRLSDRHCQANREERAENEDDGSDNREGEGEED